jgi:hypothetical protein
MKASFLSFRCLANSSGYGFMQRSLTFHTLPRCALSVSAMIGRIRRKCSSPAKSNSFFDLYERLARKAMLMRGFLEGSPDL